VVRQRALQVLRLVERTGALAAPPDVRDESEKQIEYPDVRALIRRAAAEGMVLLKNAGLLPLPADAKVAVVGPNAAVARVMGGGSAQMNRTARSRRSTVCERCWKRPCGARSGLRQRPVPTCATSRDDHRALCAPGAEVLAREERPYGEAQWVKLPAGLSADAFHARLSLVVFAPEDGEYELSLVSTGLSRLYLGDELVVDNWQGWRPGGVPVGLGSQEARCKRQLRAGAVELVAEYGPRVFFSEGIAPFQAIRIGFGRPLPPSAVTQAATVAAGADYAIVCIGTTAEWETEGEDRLGLDLPGRQDELVHAVARANPRTVVVLQTGGPVHMPWLDAVPAVVQAWFPGQEAGHAIADVLLGKAEPGGRLLRPSLAPWTMIRLARSSGMCSTPALAGRSSIARGCSPDTGTSTGRVRSRCFRSASASVMRPSSCSTSSPGRESAARRDAVESPSP